MWYTPASLGGKWRAARASSSPGRRVTLRLGLLFGLGALPIGCSSPPSSPGAVRFQVHTTPAPDDAMLSPLTDSRVSALEIRDAQTDALIAHSRFDPAPAGMPPTVTLDLGKLDLLSQRDLRMLALAGQQVLGQALHRSVSLAYGEQQDILFELRRPLFFFGGSRKLIAPTMPMSGGMLAPDFAPNKQLYSQLYDESKLRVIDPNAGSPLLAAYDRQLDASGTSALPVTAAAGTFDGQSLLVATLSSNLHVIDTLQLSDQSSIPLGDTLPVQSIVVDPMDRSATLLSYQKPTGSTGRTGHIAFVSDLAALRSRQSNGNLLGVDVNAAVSTPVGAPLSAAYSLKDGLVDVVIALPPLQLGQPDCSTLSGDGKAVIQRYNPQTASLVSSSAVPYTTAISYTASGDRVLVQPCTTAPGATLPGQIVITRKADGSQLVLPAPGTTDFAVVGDSIIAVGSEDRADGLTATMQATVRILEPNKTTWSTSLFAFPSWQVPYRVTIGVPHAVDILFAPTNVLAYGIAVTPDRARALVMMRVQHQTDPTRSGAFLYSSGFGSGYQTCFVSWSGYTYHVLLINLQSGAREQDYLVGVQNQSCSSTLFDVNKKDLKTPCFDPCDPSTTNPYLLGYQDGFVPSATSVLFGRK